MTRDKYYNRPKGCETKFLIILVLIIASIFLFSCEKEQSYNWKCWKRNLVFRAQCGPDSMTFVFYPIAKTGDDIMQYYSDSTYSKWVKKEDLQFLYQSTGIELPDSLWVESKCNCGKLVCR